ncbi:TIGR01621 family pseudouridine synthase [Paludibacterium paludis]|uniref:RNA pseudouridine synthase n=1 Tax=Paludibacterium paludis TaxID=1225769 RepID=A0A918U6K8_9NEIS|nr:TIGR01621 family pseudouridine synthase [Paludibacterium paludis]GGY03281.1 RNA pseudouridine synthase [Paludibacterium paludis]
MFRLIASDPRFHVIDKRQGTSFHRQGDEPGLFETVREALGGEPLWPVHRLDRVTSGLLLIARDERTARELGDAFAGSRVEKYYVALSDRKPSKKQGLVSGDMEKGRGGAWRLTPSRDNPAVTQFFSWSMLPGLRLFVLRPRTGRTHQLRVALKSLGAPILGDPLYHPADYPGGEPDRAYLHAWQLRFELDGEAFHFRAAPEEGRWFTHESCRTLLADEALNPRRLPWPTV